ncbi:MAG TPA: LuxR C-terminal-related transcriptional regulator [Steroidobacteraceae bacterium]|nr:LuxR C-terminal-related transcriptional regulator [Steroidobacteraceae bacterium]
MSAVVNNETWTAGNAVPLTKFRPPRLRRDVLARPELLARLHRSVADNPVTLVCAPGGSGKTTLLAQFFAQSPPGSVVLWLSIDAEENDSNRLFEALIQMLQPLGLKWDVDPLSLVDHAGGSRAQTRAALAGLVNALCTSTVSRIVLILDDLHRIEKAEALQLIDSLIERLPDHVSVVLGTRVEPDLSLAKWRAYGELGAFTPTDLRFTEEEAIALAAARFGDAIDEQIVAEALAQTRGWAAGLMLLLQSKAGFGAGPGKATDFAEPNKHLFAYLAQEVLNELPEDLQDFMLRCSILIELNPSLCGTLTGRTDAAVVLEALYRRNLFLTAIDEFVPILRFHDLFRDFLEAELARRDPALKRELHEKAASVEAVASRAIYHLLVAERWDEAMKRIAQAGEERLTHGAIATVERWIDTIPADIRAGNPVIAYLRGSCAWYRWDWLRAKDELTRAVEGLTAPEHREKRVRAMLNLVDALNSAGARDAARERVDEASRWKFDRAGKAELALQQSWCATASGDLTSVALYVQDFIEQVESDPASVCPVTAERVHCVIIGMPGIAGLFERFFNAYSHVRGAALPWHISALTIGAWAHFWRGRRIEAQATLARAEQLQHQFGGIRLVIERLGQVKALGSLMLGQNETALSVMHARLIGMEAAELAGHRAAWMRPYRHALARAHWVMGNREGYAELLPYLTAPLMPGEWPFIATAAATSRGIDALFAKSWRTAENAFREALRDFDRHRVPMVYPDARINLGYALLQQGKKNDAWAAFQPAYQEVLREHALGLFLLESRDVVNALLEIAPADVKHQPAHSGLIEHWRQWTDLTPAQQLNSSRGPLNELSERELEVLAEVASGASNKHIARKLTLSLHTVKRHIANILDKLECDSRGQAADLYRRHA